VAFRMVTLKTLIILPVILLLVLTGEPVTATEEKMVGHGDRYLVPPVLQSVSGGTRYLSPCPTTGRFNMSYVYFGNSTLYTDLVDNTDGSLDEIAPNYFDLNEDGTLKLTPTVNRSFINDMHNRGIKVAPFLSNHWDRQKGINALKNREMLAEQVAGAILEYGLDGVNVDIENMTENERDIYTDFVRLLRKKLPEGKSVSVAVVPNPYKLTAGWHASYDYAGLAKYSDYLMLMAYDEHYQGDIRKTGGPGPVAGFEFVENSIKAALQQVPPEKLLLGIPFYGRLWKRGASYGGYGISNNMVEELVKEYNGKVIYDYVQKSPRAVITIKASGKKPVVFGKTLEAGTYDIWFENEESIKRKLELVGKYGLKGTGSWSLGQEEKSTWDFYSLWLNGRYFNDIQNHWAKKSIVAAMDNGWMNGVSGASFQPDAPITRAQAAALFVRVMNIDTAGAGDRPPVFSDMAGHWAFKEIEAAAEAGLVKGTADSLFEPDKALTREQMVVLLDRIFGAKTPAQGAPAAEVFFSDVTPGSVPWSFDAINRMAAAGMVSGFPDGMFRPGDIMSRGQIAVLMVRIYPHIKEGIN
jgi:spore germination protein YaaH